MKKYILIHEHKYGTTISVIQSTLEIELLRDNLEKIAEVVGTDFEPDKGERLELTVIDPNETTTITLKNLEL